MLVKIYDAYYLEADQVISCSKDIFSADEIQITFKNGTSLCFGGLTIENVVEIINQGKSKND